ncbi:MAG: hypothetical protein IPM24_08910 [Bryobacterales bacterium]|nr:hypothetical protein [Bryobacterales bacterium]
MPGEDCADRRKPGRHGLDFLSKHPGCNLESFVHLSPASGASATLARTWGKGIGNSAEGVALPIDLGAQGFDLHTQGFDCGHTRLYGK